MPTCRISSRAVGRSAGQAGGLAFAAGLLILTPCLPDRLSAQTLTQDEALRLAFPPPATVERRTAFLTEAQLAHAGELAGPDVEVAGRVVTYYVGRTCGAAAPCGSAGAPLGVAYFDAHRVRTLSEVLMIVVAPQGTVARVDILEFREPPEYRASGRWLAQLPGRELDDELSLKGSVVNLTGATLTSRAITRAVRRALALHQVIDPLASHRP